MMKGIEKYTEREETENVINFFYFRYICYHKKVLG
jgi:hypothetical protein